MGPLDGFRIIELAGIGPSQYAGMLLADLGAEVVRVERPRAESSGFDVPERFNLMNRGRYTVKADLKMPAGRGLVLRLCEQADALIEGFRPGVMERLGLGPEECAARNKRLVYGRMTGWGQYGPLAQRAGHDANFVALSGLMKVLADPDGKPLYPPMLAGDLAGGGAFLALGLLAALLESSKSGYGQVVDAAIIDGAVASMTPFFGFLAAGMWKEGRGENLLDGASPFVAPYLTRDGEHVFVSPLEPKFFAIMLAQLGIHDLEVERQYDPSYWPVIRDRLEQVFAERTREEWSEILEGVDACCTPVLGSFELADHPHIKARGIVRDVDGQPQPAPAPRFSRTHCVIRHGPGERDVTDEILERWGLLPEGESRSGPGGEGSCDPA
jgi:alpha-methylacyl-CoA racemase